MIAAFPQTNELGEIHESRTSLENENALEGYWENDDLFLFFQGQRLSITGYDLVQNVFSRNTGILESRIMRDKCAFMLGCGSVGSLVALELARAGVGKFVLIDNDIVEYHNICRHQCSIMDVGEYKVHAVARRIKEINPEAVVQQIPRIVEEVGKDIFDEYCLEGNAILIGCADNRTADVYANSIAISYGVPFISIGFWERAFAGEIFYHLPRTNTPCYKCALGDGGGLSQRQSTNRRIYTNEENLARVNFEPGISVDINFVTTIGIKLILDILNIGNDSFTPRLLDHLQQYTLICNTNNPKIGGEMAEIFSYPLQVTTSLQVGYGGNCPPCEYAG
jgi:molybdopterin/thiamine biosynthesis adenylyltransferase